MKIIRIVNKSFKDAFKSVFRNFSLSMASVSCTAITLILVSIALLATHNVNSITKDIEDVLTIVAFVDASATEEETENIKKQINLHNQRRPPDKLHIYITEIPQNQQGRTLSGGAENPDQQTQYQAAQTNAQRHGKSIPDTDMKLSQKRKIQPHMNGI